MLGNHYEYNVMSKAEERHWWYRTLHRQVIREIRKHFAADCRILDAGCGTGGLLLKLRDHGFENAEGCDLDPYAVELAIRKGAAARQGSLQEIDALGEKKYDCIVCCDVLYFLRGDEQKIVLAKMLELLRDNGRIVINIPALEIFRGIHDICVGIKSRASKKSIQNVLPKNALLSRAVYWPFLVSPIIFFVRFLQRQKLKYRSDKNFTSDIKIPGWIVNSLLNGICFVDSLLPWRPFGSSLFVVIRKSDSA